METANIIGLLLIIGAIGHSYNVLFNTSSSEYWNSSFSGKKFKQGCITPIILTFIGYALLQYSEKDNINNNNSQQVKQSPNKNEKEEDQKSKHSNFYIVSDLPEFKKYVNDNYKAFLKDKSLITTAINLMETRKKILIKQNKNLRKEINIVKKLDMTKKEKQVKISSINKSGKSNQREINAINEKIAYLNKIFSSDKSK